MSRRLTKRQYMRRMSTVLGGAGAAALAGCSGDADTSEGGSTTTASTESGGTTEPTETTTDAPLGSSYDEELPVLLPDGDIQIPFYLSPDVREYFNERQVNIAPEVTAYERSSRALSTGSAMINPTAPAEWINMVSGGNEIALVGGEVKQINGIFTLPDSDIEGPQDLEGSTLGLPYMNSGTTKMMGAMLQDAYDIDIREDVESQSAGPAVLYSQMVEDGSLDAVMLWTGHTVKALANDDEVRQVMSATDHWVDQTGEAPMILNYGVRRDWLEEYPGEALGYIKAWDDGVNWAFEQNAIQSMYQQYGRLAGLTTEAERETLLDLFDEERVLMHPQSDWDGDLVDAQWELYELMEETGFIESAPSRDLGITHSELTDMA